MPKTNISDSMRSVIGGEIGRQTSFPITDSDIRRWVIAVYYPETPPRRYWDPEYAKSTRQGGIVAPQDFNPFAWMAASTEGPELDANIDPHDPNRTELLLGAEPHNLKFQLNGGLEVEYGAPMRPGDVITSVTRLAGYREREGRLGLMLFTTQEETWTNQDDEVVQRRSNTVIRY
jgi:hypothetical protein